SRTSAGANTVRYVLEDHQGSIAALATSGGSLAVNESFTPFGQRRSGSTWQLPISGGDQTTIDGISRRGYTGHNHLGGAPLIHMNGRMQDPLTGRFLSADPYVANPASTQGWNRYSYVENDPASYTDPSGFVRSCGIGFAAISVPTIGYGFGGGGADGYGGGGFSIGYATTWIPVISCADIPESAVLPRTNLDTPRYSPQAVQAGLKPLVFADDLPRQNKVYWVTPDVYEAALGAQRDVAAVVAATGTSIAGGAIAARILSSARAAIGGIAATARGISRFPGTNPAKAPDGFVWKGKPSSVPESKDGNWYNPKTGESLRPDLSHPGPIGPHWDNRDAAGKWWRVFPDGRQVPK
ncbi:MAG: hypothetical protein EPO25_14675, partial [Gammaproteobacteria bacterium]